MKHIIAILGILFLTFIWILPAFMIWYGFKADWAFLYLAVILITFAFGSLLDNWYK